MTFFSYAITWNPPWVTRRKLNKTESINFKKDLGMGRYSEPNYGVDFSIFRDAICKSRLFSLVCVVLWSQQTCSPLHGTDAILTRKKLDVSAA